MKKLLSAAAVAAAFAVALALPAQAKTVDQDTFVADCNTTLGPPGGDSVIGTVTVPAGTELQVKPDLSTDTFPGVIDVDCTVTLGADSQLQLGEDTDLLFDDSGDFKDFTITGVVGAAEVAVQVKKNSTIEAEDLTITVTGDLKAEVKFGENFCLRLHSNGTTGDLMIAATSSGHGGDVQFKKFESSTVKFKGEATECGASPNIKVDGSIVITVTGGDSDFQIEEDNDVMAGGSITLTATSANSKLQTKKSVMLTADGPNVGPGDDGTMHDITLSAASSGGEVQVEENNDFLADDDITVSSGAAGKTEVKNSNTVFLAGGITTVSSVGDCKIESTAGWSDTSPAGSCTIAD